jgi:hypothetical protein
MNTALPKGFPRDFALDANSCVYGSGLSLRSPRNDSRTLAQPGGAATPP